MGAMSEAQAGAIMERYRNKDAIVLAALDVRACCVSILKVTNVADMDPIISVVHGVVLVVAVGARSWSSRA